MTGGNDNRRRSDERQRGEERSSAESSIPDETKTAHELNRSGDENALENDPYPEEPLEDALPEPEPEDTGEDSAIVPDERELDPNFIEEPQLSPDERVPQDMGTIALERVPGDRRAANGSMPPFLAGELAHMTDAEIMQRAGAGDDTCFEFLVAKYRRPIIGFMYRMVHNQAVAEELAQEVFLRVYRARSSYRAEARFTTWLYRIASNMAINHARDTKHERASSSVYLDQADEETGTTPDVADLRPLVEQDLLHDERMRRIREHVAALPERQKMAVVMHKYQDMDYKQIGAVLKLSESATKSLLFRAYQTLRDRLKEFA